MYINRSKLKYVDLDINLDRKSENTYEVQKGDKIFMGNNEYFMIK